MNYNGKYSLRKALLVEYFDAGDFPDLQGRDQKEIDRQMKISLGEKPVETWQDLRDLITLHLKQEEFLARAEAEGDLAGKIGKAIISFFTPLDEFAAIGGAVKDAAELSSKLNSLSQDRKPQKMPLLDTLQMDPEYAEIIEYGLQDDMVRDFMEDISQLTGNITENPANWQNMDEYAEYWLAKRRETGGSEETVTGADDSTKFSELTIPNFKQSKFAGFGTFLAELF
tara:strand:- start:5582 stop:6262 length:681 start_codon:yes stop_codon:yes gene_type:complete